MTHVIVGKWGKNLAMFVGQSCFQESGDGLGLSAV
jgi:hypothetical protein